MARPNQEAIDTFITITGVTGYVAVQKIEEHGGDLNAAINAHFSEGERSTRPSSSGQSNIGSHPPPLHNGDPISDEWGGIFSEELDEAVMLEAAMFGGIPEGTGYRFPYAPHQFMQSENHYPRPVPHPPSSSLQAQRMIREQQEHGGDLNAAVNAHFSEGETSTVQQPSVAAPQDDPVPMDIDDDPIVAAPLPRINPQSFPAESTTMNPFSALRDISRAELNVRDSVGEGPFRPLVNWRENDWDEDRERENDRVCSVCMERNKDAAFIPCGHTFCRDCSNKLLVVQGCCPICRRCIEEILNIF